MPAVSALGAIVALSLAIILILRKIPPVYGMLIGALVGGLVGGADLTQTVSLMIGGAQGITSAVLRILGAGILAGVLIESGAASIIATTIVQKLGENKALFALALASAILTAVGVFIDVAVITVAPIALAIAQKIDISKLAILLAMIGGGKAGNLISPNPNAIAAAEAFNLPLTSIMLAGIVPAIFGLLLVSFIAPKLAQVGSKVEIQDLSNDNGSKLPSFLAAISAPISAILLLALRPMCGIVIDPLIALPLGGLVGTILMGRLKDLNHFMTQGLMRMAPVAIMLLGTGTLAGIIANSALKDVLIQTLSASGLPAYALAPISGIIMSMATASTTASTAVASNVFAATLLEAGVSAIASAAMIHAGATVLDHLPHGSFFHATGGSVMMGIKERLKLLPYETLIGLSMTIIATLIFGVFNFA